MLQNFKRYYGAHTGDVGKRFEVMDLDVMNCNGERISSGNIILDCKYGVFYYSPVKGERNVKLTKEEKTQFLDYVKELRGTLPWTVYLRNLSYWRATRAKNAAK